jgi:hypothetical protein
VHAAHGSPRSCDLADTPHDDVRDSRQTNLRQHADWQLCTGKHEECGVERRVRMTQLFRQHLGWRGGICDRRADGE